MLKFVCWKHVTQAPQQSEHLRGRKQPMNYLKSVINHDTQKHGKQLLKNDMEKGKPWMIMTASLSNALTGGEGLTSSFLALRLPVVERSVCISRGLCSRDRWPYLSFESFIFVDWSCIYSCMIIYAMSYKTCSRLSLLTEVGFRQHVLQFISFLLHVWM